MTNLLIHNYYHRYREYKRQIKNLLNGGNNSQEAKTKLDLAVIENDNYIASRGIINDGSTFTSVDNLSLHHAQDHLNAFEQTNEIQQKDATINALDEG